MLFFHNNLFFIYIPYIEFILHYFRNQKTFLLSTSKNTENIIFDRCIINMNMEFKTQILDELALNRAIKRLSHEIIEHNNGVNDLVLVGIKTRGVPFGKILQQNLLDLEGIKVPLVEVDITLYRDDLTEINPDPTLNEDKIDIDLTSKTVILCDDVLYTGRTCRAAIDAVLKHGRPKSVQFAVIIDRGHRELPIRADYVGKNVPTSHNEIIAVKFKEIDGKSCVDLYNL